MAPIAAHWRSKSVSILYWYLILILKLNSEFERSCAMLKNANSVNNTLYNFIQCIAFDYIAFNLVFESKLNLNSFLIGGSRLLEANTMSWQSREFLRKLL